MMRKSTLLFVLLAFTTGALWAGEGKGVLKRAQARLQQKGQYSKAFYSADAAASQAPVSFYQGQKLYKSAAAMTAQVDDATSNTTVWGIYGPGRNLVRDPESGRLTGGWSRTPTGAPKPRTIFSANSVDGGATWTVNGPLDEQTSSRGYYSDVFRAGSNDAGGVTEWITWSERDSKRLDIIQDLVPGSLIFDSPRPLITTTNIPAPDPTLDMVFTHAAAAPNGDGTWSIYVSEYATGHATEKDNIIFVKSTDNGQTWSAPKFIFSDAPGQVPKLYQTGQFGSAQGNYCALAMAVDPNDSKHIGGVFISNNMPNYDPNSADSLLHPYGTYGDTDYQYYFIESRDAGDTWSTPEMLLGRDPIARRQWEFTTGIDTTGDGNFDVSNKAYLYGGAFFWAFLYQPVYTSDGSFHIAFMPTLFEDVPAGGLAVGIGSNYNVPCYGRRDANGQWSYKVDFVGTTLGFDSTATELDPRFGQAWFAEMSKSADEKAIGISWSSRLPAYTPGPGHNGYEKKGCFVVAASPDKGKNWTEAKAFFVDGGLPEGTAGTGAGEQGSWPGSSVGILLVPEPENPNIYRFEFIYQALGADNVNIFRQSQGIWYTNEPFADLSTVGVNDRPSGAPTTYSLGQNYPNPFNPSTTIDYSLSAAGQVKLTVVNAIGQVVATLVNGKVAAGQHTVVWDAKSVPSGVYFYKLEAESFSQTKKMVLMK